MKKSDNLILRQYLLGLLPEEEQNQLEDRFLSDDAHFEQILVAEDELIDAYLRGELSRKDRQQFEKHFLISPQRREQVEMARALLQAVSEEQPQEKPATAWQRLTSWWRSVQASWRIPEPALQFAYAMAVLVLIIGGTWLLWEIRGLHSRLAQRETERFSLLQREQALQQQLAQQREHGSQLEEQLKHEQSQRAQLEQELTEMKPPQLAMVSFVLSPGMAREGEGPTVLVLPAAAHTVQFQLDLEGSDVYKSYRAGLRNVKEELIWSQDGLPVKATEWSKFVVLQLPTLVLSSADYALTLRGLTTGENFEVVGSYYFRVVKR